MGSLANRLRRIWQTYSGSHGQQAENHFYNAFKQAFEDSNFEIIKHPNNFKHIYENVELPKKQKESKLY